MTTENPYPNAEGGDGQQHAQPGPPPPQQPYGAPPPGQAHYQPQPGQPVISSGISFGQPVLAPNGQLVQPKNPALSVIASFLLPGLGQVLNGDNQKGIILIASYVGAWVLFTLLVIILIGFLFLPVAFGIWVYGMWDAYQGAVKWNQQYGVTG